MNRISRIALAALVACACGDTSASPGREVGRIGAVATGSAVNSSARATPTPTFTAAVTATPTPVPTATPTPSPTPKPPPGTVLYQANSSEAFSRWVGSSDWKVVGGALVSDGSNPQISGGFYSPVATSILAPWRDTIQDYAVEAEITVIRIDSPSLCLICDTSFGIVVRDVGGISGYHAGWMASDGQVQIWSGDGSKLTGRAFRPGTQPRTYRVEVRGNTVRMLVDGAPMLEAVDNRYLRPGAAGLWNGRYMQLSVRNVKVIAL